MSPIACSKGFHGMKSVVIVALCSALTALAQVSSSTLTGHVTNRWKQPVAGAGVTVKSGSNSFARSAVSDGSGIYSLVDIPPGAYSVSIERHGYRSVTISHITVEVNQRADLDIVIEAGAGG